MRNDYEVRGEITVIFLESPKHGKKEMLIDTEDLPLVLKTFKSISVLFNCKVYYGFGKTKDVPRKSIHVHRVIMNCPKGMVVDHINHNGLDNRKSNLRNATHLENVMNRNGADKDSKSGVRGVHWSPHDESWHVKFRVNKKTIAIGCFKEFDEAKEIAETACSKIKNVEEFMKFVVETKKNRRDKLSAEKKSGIKGISWKKSLNKWQVTINVNGERKYIGVYKDIEDAKKALELGG